MDADPGTGHPAIPAARLSTVPGLAGLDEGIDGGVRLEGPGCKPLRGEGTETTEPIEGGDIITPADVRGCADNG